MSPRRNVPRRRRARAPETGADDLVTRVTGGERRESGPDGEWSVRPVSGAAAVKHYRCPGCYQLIPPGMAHVVAWPAGQSDAEERRHWHTSCWQHRLRRGVRPPRGG